jgi:hypothetical protein
MITGMSWLIDRSGVCWPTCAHPIARWDPACDPVGYAVSNLGASHLRPLNGGVTVSLNPSRVGRKRMISAFYVIAAEQPKRIALSHGRQGPDLELFGTVGEAFRHIEELVETHPNPTSVRWRRRRTLDHLPKHIAERTKELLRLWSNWGGEWTRERHATSARRFL